jgi:hypothetical protein
MKLNFELQIDFMNRRCLRQKRGIFGLIEAHFRVRTQRYERENSRKAGQKDPLLTEQPSVHKV